MVDGWRQPSFLDRLAERDRTALLQLGTPQQVAAGQSVLRLGEAGADVVVLEAGYVKVTSTDPQAHHVILDIGGRGGLYGEAAVISGRPRMADVVALSELSVRRIDADSFIRFLRAHPDAGHQLLVLFACRLSDAQRQRTHTRAPDTVTRVARRLAYLVGVCGRNTGSYWQLEAPLSQEELAAFIPLGRTALATALEQLRELGVISTRRRGLSVLDLDRLLQLANM
ncbi:hypothetical protein GCM10022222_33300 [Amycolatopsis ultiminotia]|uniref:cAMP-binding domain of CRP or a regulatory subunit of cAMP-dependent protein kinases n=1 Tax=Amycolatopsis ultiminotia TaxID=543629 RepID=A0ABP6W8D3_9PSEU